jgi:hypothetical protein
MKPENCARIKTGACVKECPVVIKAASMLPKGVSQLDAIGEVVKECPIISGGIQQPALEQARWWGLGGNK